MYAPVAPEVAAIARQSEIDHTHVGWTTRCCDAAFVLLPFGAAVLLTSALYAQHALVQDCLYGEHVHRLVDIIGAAGSLSAFLLVLCVCCVCHRRPGVPWYIWAGLVLAFVAQAVIFEFLSYMPYFVQTAELREVDTAIEVLEACAGGRLLRVTETLTYDLEAGATRFVDRQLDSAFEPTAFAAAAALRAPGQPRVPEVEAVTWKRYEPGRLSLNYMEGFRTVVTIGFKDAVVAQGQGGQGSLRFRVVLRYDARLPGDRGSRCNGGETNATVFSGPSPSHLAGICGAVDGQRWVEGIWVVPYDVGLDAGSHPLALHVPDGWNAEPVRSVYGAAEEMAEKALEREGAPPRKFALRFQVPEELPLGDPDECPLAWEVKPENSFWQYGTTILALAAMICLVSWSLIPMKSDISQDASWNEPSYDCNTDSWSCILKFLCFFGLALCVAGSGFYAVAGAQDLIFGTVADASK